MTYPEPYPGWHCIVLDEQATPEGWRAWCVPHGPLGTWGTHLEMMVGALEHDEEHCGNGVA